MADEIVTTKEADSKLSKRGAHLISTAGAPAAIVAFTGDLFGPKGGWIVVGLIGFISLIAAAYFIFSLANLKTGSVTPWWYKITNGDKELNWIWNSQPVFLAHGVHVAIVFGVICIFSAGKTYAAINSGGYLGKNIDAIAAAQKQLGISQAILAEQKKTNEQLESLNEKAFNFKKESSDDPRKELTNLGVPWNDTSFENALERQDITTVRLFIKANYRTTNRTVWLAIKGINSGNIEMQKMLTQYFSPMSMKECNYIFRSIKIDDSAIQAAEKSGLVKQICSSAEVQDMLAKDLSRLQFEYDQQVEMHKKWNARTPIEKRRAEEKYQKCLTDPANASRVLFGTLDCGPDTRPPLEPNDSGLRRLQKVMKLMS